jgi:NAD(P)-dependent dehydrogenase (short-subunit alcohol dehydrogenase family)
MSNWSVEIPHDRVVVTGGGSGIGRAMALELAGLGRTVYVMGRREEKLLETAKLGADLPGRIVAQRCDATDPDQVAAAFAVVENDGLATGLVHAAAQVSLGLARDIDPREFQRTVESTLCTTFNVLQRWGVALIDAGRSGAAVAFTSATATGGIPGISHSSAGKAGVVSLARALGREWGPYDVRVNCIGPGAFPIAKSEEMFGADVVSQRMAEVIALGRYGQMPEIIGPTMFLLSAAASYITGQHLVVDGGQTLLEWIVPKEALEQGLNNRYEPAPAS